MEVAEFRAKAATFKTPKGVDLFKRSILNIRDGGGVIESIFDEGKYKRCLEIGTYHGVSAAFIASRCEHVTTIDLLHGRMEETGDILNVPEFWRHMGLDNIERLLVASDAHKAEVVSGLDFDIAFIDGGKHNIAFDFDLVKRCGTVLFHDVDSRGSPELDRVYDFVMGLPKHQVERRDIFAIWHG